jgi:hypothetical protein
LGVVEGTVFAHNNSAAAKQQSPITLNIAFSF